jgi:hypothetical protein
MYECAVVAVGRAGIPEGAGTDAPRCAAGASRAAADAARLLNLDAREGDNRWRPGHLTRTTSPTQTQRVSGFSRDEARVGRQGVGGTARDAVNDLIEAGLLARQRYCY